MTDRELLEAAAKAAGHTGFTFINNQGAVYLPEPGKMQPYKRWNPLTDDGDALRLAVKLGMTIGVLPQLNKSYCHGSAESARECHSTSDPYAATRRAIVRAAAAMADPVRVKVG